jgi:hypothetical protein
LETVNQTVQGLCKPLALKASAKPRCHGMQPRDVAAADIFIHKTARRPPSPSPRQYSRACALTESGSPSAGITCGVHQNIDDPFTTGPPRGLTDPELSSSLFPFRPYRCSTATNVTLCSSAGQNGLWGLDRSVHQPRELLVCPKKFALEGIFHLQPEPTQNRVNLWTIPSLNPCPRVHRRRSL